MRVAFLILPIFICAGVVLASRDHDGQNRHEGHDQNKRYEMNSGVDVSDELLQSYNGQEGRHYNTRGLFSVMAKVAAKIFRGVALPALIGTVWKRLDKELSSVGKKSSLDHDGQNRHKGHNQNRRYFQIGRDLDVNDKPPQIYGVPEGSDIHPPILLGILEQIAGNIDFISSLLNTLVNGSPDITVPDYANNDYNGIDKVVNLEDSIRRHIIPHHTKRKEHSRPEKFAQPESKRKAT
ncbi:hypothetical protein Trydic_g2352 [Trypoxylus dichotomus]